MNTTTYRGFDRFDRHDRSNTLLTDGTLRARNTGRKNTARLARVTRGLPVIPVKPVIYLSIYRHLFTFSRDRFHDWLTGTERVR